MRLRVAGGMIFYGMGLGQMRSESVRFQVKNVK